MPRLDINTPFETDQAVITVEIDPAKPLPRGRQIYELVVVDDSGNVSAPDRIIVIVADRERPTAVLQGPSIADIGKAFDLNGTKSFDIGGSIKVYRFTYLGPQI
jgi:hypothetical protein